MKLNKNIPTNEIENGSVYHKHHQAVMSRCWAKEPERHFRFRLSASASSSDGTFQKSSRSPPPRHGLLPSRAIPFVLTPAGPLHGPSIVQDYKRRNTKYFICPLPSYFISPNCYFFITIMLCFTHFSILARAIASLFCPCV